MVASLHGGITMLDKGTGLETLSEKMDALTPPPAVRFQSSGRTFFNLSRGNRNDIVTFIIWVRMPSMIPDFMKDHSVHFPEESGVIEREGCLIGTLRFATNDPEASVLQRYENVLGAMAKMAGDAWPNAA
jgi:hypothetical protein